MDNRLGCEFKNNHFVITYDRACGGTVNIHRVQREDGGFRHPDNRELDLLLTGDNAKILCQKDSQRLPAS